MFESASVEDIDWLLGPQAKEELAALAGDLESSPNLIARLRQRLSLERTALLVETATLRRRGLEKFSLAGQMFLTSLGLQQATDSKVAEWKSQRFASCDQIIDLCCGIGGDLMALARAAPTTGVDLSEVAIRFAQANARVVGGTAKFVKQKATTIDLKGASWHIDPDRRPHGRRTTRVELHEPNLEALNRMRSQSADAAIKLAPAATPPELWLRECELEWISRDGQCRQLVAWSGRLAAAPGVCVATALRGEEAFTFAGQPGSASRRVVPCGEVIFDPDPALVAAHLVDSYAQTFGLARLDPRTVYLTGDRPDVGGMLTAFRVRDVLPLKEPLISRYLKEHGVGRLEVKHRGIELDPDALRRRLKPRGDAAATLIVSPTPEGARAIVCDRLPTASGAGG